MYANIRYGLCAVACAALAGGCRHLPASAVRQLDQARAALAAGRYEVADHFVAPVLSAHGASRDAASAYYIRAQCRLQTGARDAAIHDLTTARRLASDPALRAQVDAQLGNVAFDDDAYDSAAAFYARALPRLPRLAPADRVIYQYAVSLQRVSRFTDARRAFGMLVREFPNSALADAARRRQAWTESYFAIQCGVFSRDASAREVATSLRARGFDALSIPEAHDGGMHYVVRVGHYPTYADAARTLPTLRQFIHDAFIVP